MRFITASPISGMSGMQRSSGIFVRWMALTPRDPKNTVTLAPCLSRFSAVIMALKTWHSSSWKHMMETFLFVFMIVPFQDVEAADNQTCAGSSKHQRMSCNYAPFARVPITLL